MKKQFIIGVILGSILSAGVSYGYRIPKPQRITDFNQNGLVVLNESLEQLYDLTNGRISLNSGATASTGVGSIKMGSTNSANSAGFLKIERTDGVMVYIPYFTDDTP